jgi:hypothetical protein
MAAARKLRRLLDLPGVADLEFKALMKPAAAEPENRADFPEIGVICASLFGLTPDEAEDVPRPADWDHPERKPIPAQVAAFEAEGWDVTDDRRRPLRMLRQLNEPLWLALRGVAGALPFQPDNDGPDPMASSLAREAARFRRR